MAYRPRKTTRRTASRSRTTRGTSRRYTRTPARRARRSTARGGTRTVRIVVEQVAANTVARPPLGMVQAPAPRKATF